MVLVRKPTGGLEFVAEADVDGPAGGIPVVHDPGASDPSQAFAISRLDSPEMTHVPMGIFRQVIRPTYDELVRAQVDQAVSNAGGAHDDASLAELLRGADTWTVG